MAFQLVSAVNTYKNVCFPVKSSTTTRSSKWSGHLSSILCLPSSGTAGDQAFLSSNSDQLDRSQSATFPPSIWGSHFASFSFDHLEFESLERRVEILRTEIRQMLVASADDPVKKIEVIDTICRLGVSYHFVCEIEEQLIEMFESEPFFLDEHDYDLHTVALTFRVFRQHGFKIPCDVFEKFKGNDGKFEEHMRGDNAKAMLSLYEASHVSTPGEDILDDALAFSKAYLETLTVQSNPQLSRRIANALRQPLHTGFERVEARKHIDFYEGEKGRNRTLLNLAKLDYNRVQLLHQQELSCLSSWWKDLNLEKQVSYARERMVESYLCMVGLHSEPQYACARIMGTKNLMLLSVVDDTYDSYGSIDELQSLTEAIERWDVGALDQLPDYLKILYKALLDTFEEFEKEARAEERCYSFHGARDAVKEIVRAYHAEAQWCNKGYVPTFDEYMKIGSVTSSTREIAAISFMGMGEIAGIVEFGWLQTKPKIITSSAFVVRLRDDISDDQEIYTPRGTRAPFMWLIIIINNLSPDQHLEAEERRAREHVASSVECYMNQYGVSREKAIEELERKIAQAWKETNEECMRPAKVSIHLLKLAANTARMSEVFSKHFDGYTNPIYLKETIADLFIDQIPIEGGT